MKKLTALILAVITVFVLCVPVIADDSAKTFTVYTGDSSKYYNPGSEIYVVFSLRDINFGTDDGISAVEFYLNYDSSKVTPVPVALEDENGFECNYDNMLVVSPQNWESFGLLNTAKSRYELAMSDMNGGCITMDDSLVIEVPFVVKNDCRGSDIVFSLTELTAYNSDLQACSNISAVVTVRYAVQPEENSQLPEKYVPLHYSGYSHTASNLIFYTPTSLTLGQCVKNFCGGDFNETGMKNFAVIIAGADGVITYISTDSTNKSDVIIPARHFFVAVNTENSADYSYVKGNGAIGKQLTVYNVNLEGTFRYQAQALTDAGFVISSVGELPPFIGGDDPNVDPDPDPDPTPDPVTEMKGDINCNGKIDARDYLLLKRAYFGTYTLVCSEYVWDINGNGKIDARDYLLLKRAYFGTYTIA